VPVTPARRPRYFTLPPAGSDASRDESAPEREGGKTGRKGARCGCRSRQHLNTHTVDRHA